MSPRLLAWSYTYLWTFRKTAQKYSGKCNYPSRQALGGRSRQIMEELRQKIMETGLLPTKLKNGGSLINVTPQRLEDQSG